MAMDAIGSVENSELLKPVDSRRRLSCVGKRRESVAHSTVPHVSPLVVPITCDGIRSDDYPELWDKFQALNSTWESDEPCDVTIKIQEREVDVHKKVLMAFSPYFRAMFSSGLAESQPDAQEVVLRDVDPAATEAVLNFAYTGRLALNQDNVQDVLEVCSLFHLDDILRECWRFIKDSLDPSNCIGIAQYAEFYFCQTVLESAQRYVYCHFAEAASYNEFMEMELSSLLTYIGNDCLYVKDEEQLYQIAVAWLLHDPSNRKQHTKQVLYKIRFRLIPADLLSSMISATHNYGINNLSHSIQQYLLHKMEQPNTRAETSCIPIRRYLRDSLVATGGYTPTGDCVSAMEAYDIAGCSWYWSEDMPTKKSGLSATTLDGLLYIVGGTNQKLVFNSVYRYNPLQKTWFAGAAPMTSPRAYHGAVSARGYLYALGGWNNDCQCLNSMEKYDAVSNKWRVMPPMSVKRLSFGVAEHAGKIYVCGGNDGVFTLNSVERFDIVTETWETLTPMTSRRANLGCAFYDEFLYAIGGDKEDPVGCERMDTSRAPHVWRRITSMNCPRPHGPRVLNFGNLLYALGGSDRNERTVLEVLDPVAESWSCLPNLPSPNRIDMAFTILRL